MALRIIYDPAEALSYISMHELGGDIFSRFPLRKVTPAGHNPE